VQEYGRKARYAHSILIVMLEEKRTRRRCEDSIKMDTK
jgi:hypothetical protein